MSDFFIRLIFGLLCIGILFGISNFFKTDWLQEGKPLYNLIIIPILIGGWGGWYLFKSITYKKN
jgi:hypothetical protein